MQSVEGVAEHKRGDVMVSEGREFNRDTVALARSGKKQVLTVSDITISLSTAIGAASEGNTKCFFAQRRFGLVSMTGFSCGLMCTWEGMLV